MLDLHHILHVKQTLLLYLLAYSYNPKHDWPELTSMISSGAPTSEFRSHILNGMAQENGAVSCKL